MALSNDLVSQFVKATKDDTSSKSGSTVYGTVIKNRNKLYVRIDGSDQLTPITTTADIKDGERVSVLIQNHTAVVNGNTTAPSASSSDLKEVVEDVSGITRIVADKVDTKDLEANYAHITNGVIDNAKIDQADVNNLNANYAHITNGVIDNAKIDQANVNNLNANYAHITNGVIDNAQIGHANVKDLNANYAHIQNGVIDNAQIGVANVKDLNTSYANIDFANIGEAAVRKIFSDSGIIKDLVVESGAITGELVGVTIKGDLIEGNTIVADKLVVKGEDGLYYKLNTDGVTTEAEQTDYNSINGSIITAKSITATKINVTDLVAFGATIGGFHIGEHSIYSGAKTSATNATKGIYMDDDGQFSLGDGTNFFRYFKDTDGKYKISIQADSLKFSSGKSVTETIDDAVDDTIDQVYAEYYLSNSSSSLSGGTWSTNAPNWEEGKYMWSRTVTVTKGGTTNYTPSENGVCIAGAKGSSGEDAVTLRIDSSRGTVFKNNSMSTVLSVVIYKGSVRITNITELRSSIGAGAYLEWYWQKIDEDEYGVISATDKMLSNDGFNLTISSEEVDTKVTFRCELKE